MAGWALAALLTLGGCQDAGPDMAAASATAPGDPTIYAPAGWPLQIGDRVSWERAAELRERFRLPGLPGAGESAFTAVSSSWRSYTGMHLVGDRVYAALIVDDPTKLGDYTAVYRGHFPIRFRESLRRQEPDLPPEFHGKIKYYTRLLVPDDHHITGVRTFVIDPGIWDADGTLLKLDSDFVPRPPDPLVWPDYRGGRK